MSARAMWKAVLRLGAEAVPIKLYSAVEDRSVHFHLLHDEDHARVHQRMAHARTGKTVAPEDRRKGLEIRPGTYVVLDEDELNALQPEASRDVDVTGFVARGEIPEPWYVRPYWLGPDASAPEYFALAQAMAAEGVEGLAHWVMRGKRYDGALRSEGGHLVLVTLHHAAEVVARGQLEAPRGRDASAQERELAGRLVAALEGPFAHEDWEDEHRRRVLELIEAKRKGETVEVIELPRRESPASLSDALEASLQRAG